MVVWYNLSRAISLMCCPSLCLYRILNPFNLRGHQITSTTLWYGGIGSCANFVKFSMSPNGLFGISTLNLISGGPYDTINFFVMLHLGPI